MDKIPRDTMMNPIMKIRIRAHTTSSLMAVRGSRKGRLEGKEAKINGIYLKYCLDYGYNKFPAIIAKKGQISENPHS